MNKAGRGAYFRKYWRTHKAKLKKPKGFSTAWKRAHPKAAREHVQQWRIRHPKKRKLYARIARAKRSTLKAKSGGSFTVLEWNAMCKKYKYKCLCCRRRRKLTADHIIPISKGGTSNIDNIQTLCGPCNFRKSTKTIDYRT